MTDFDFNEQRLRRTLKAVAERSPVSSDYELRRLPVAPTTYRPRRLLVGAVVAVVIIAGLAVALAYGPRSSVGGSGKGNSPANGSSSEIRWSPSRAVAPNFGLALVQCTSASFCLGLGANGNTGATGTTLWDGSTWSKPRALGAPPNGVVRSLACASPTFCEALSTGAAYRWNGVSWSSSSLLEGAFARNDPTEVTSVACPTPSFCMAVDSAGDDFTFNGQKWSAPAHFDDTPSPTSSAFGPSSVSCASPISCMVVDSDGYALRWNGTAWLVPVDVTPPTLVSVSCPASNWCLTMNQSSYASIWNGQGWSGPQFVDPESMQISQRAGSTTGASWGQGDFGLLSASCASRTFCVAIDDSGYAVSFDGTSWSSPAPFGPGFDNNDIVSCAAPRFCVATTDEGLVTMTGG
jgi:hypothetical protein